MGPGLTAVRTRCGRRLTTGRPPRTPPARPAPSSSPQSPSAPPSRLRTPRPTSVRASRKVWTFISRATLETYPSQSLSIHRPRRHSSVTSFCCTAIRGTGGTPGAPRGYFSGFPEFHTPAAHLMGGSFISASRRVRECRESPGCPVRSPVPCRTFRPTRPPRACVRSAARGSRPGAGRTRPADRDRCPGP